MTALALSSFGRVDVLGQEQDIGAGDGSKLMSHLRGGVVTRLRPSRAPNMVGVWIEVVQPARYPWLGPMGAGAVLDRLEEHEERPLRVPDP